MQSSQQHQVAPSRREHAALSDPEAEAVVVGAALAGESEAIDALVTVKCGDFLDPAHAGLWALAQENLRSGRPLELVAIAGRAAEIGRRDLVDRAAELEAAHGTAAALGYYVARIREFAHLRRVGEALRQGQSMLSDPELECTERLDGVAREVFEALEARPIRNFGTAGHLALEVEREATERREARARGEAPRGIATPAPALDDAMGGGLQPGRSVVLGARTGHGKSTLAGDVVLRAAEAGRPALVVALEATRQEWFLSVLWKASGIRPIAAREGWCTPEELDEGLARVRSLPLLIESGRFALGDLAALIRRARIVHRVELVVVDYVQLVQHRIRGATRSTELAEVSATLKRLAMDLELCVLALVQLNKGPEDREGGTPHLRDVRESEALAHDADQVVFLVRPDLRTGGGEPYLVLEKNRHGPTVGRVPLIYEERYNRYRQRLVRAVA